MKRLLSFVTVLGVLVFLGSALPAQAELDPLDNPPADPGTIPDTRTEIGPDDFGPDAVTVNFDDLVGGDNYCSGDHITDQYPGLLFSVPYGTCSVCANSVLGALILTNSDPNVAYSQQNVNVCGTTADHSEVAFDPPVTRVGAYFFTSVNANFRIRSYNASDELLDDYTVTGTDLGDGFWSGFLGVDAGGPVIAKIHMLSRPVGGGSSFNFSIDDFIYEGGAPVPVVPASWGHVKSIYR